MEVPLIMEREQMQVIGPQLINISVGHKQLCIASAKLSDANQWAFGDGNHPSTRVALKGLETYVTRNTLRVLDYGCGTGILGIAAVVLGATEVVAVDISTCALELTRENWERNVPHEGDATLSILHASDYQPEPRHDIIVANMPANTLMSLLASLLASLKQDGGGMLLFSGYSSRESIQVSGPVIQAGLMELEPIYDSGWVLQVFCASGTVNDENYSDVP
jgi:ribosomal protein L11 methyltransferase